MTDIQLTTYLALSLVGLCAVGSVFIVILFKIFQK